MLYTLQRIEYIPYTLTFFYTFYVIILHNIILHDPAWLPNLPGIMALISDGCPTPFIRTSFKQWFTQALQCGQLFAVLVTLNIWYSCRKLRHEKSVIWIIRILILCNQRSRLIALHFYQAVQLSNQNLNSLTIAWLIFKSN